ncbi:MAG: hypothetical protein JXB24_06990 [Bacteroidales bacterium]|nr:hypothetical protein [Bacteroidales bacterium]
MHGCIFIWRVKTDGIAEKVLFRFARSTYTLLVLSLGGMLFFMNTLMLKETG